MGSILGKAKRLIVGLGKRAGLAVAAVVVLFFLDVVLLGDDDGTPRAK